MFAICTYHFTCYYTCPLCSNRLWALCCTSKSLSLSVSLCVHLHLSVVSAGILYLCLSAPVHSVSRDHHLHLFKILIGNPSSHTTFLFLQFAQATTSTLPTLIPIASSHSNLPTPSSSHPASESVVFTHLLHSLHSQLCLWHTPSCLLHPLYLQVNQCSCMPPLHIHCHIISILFASSCTCQFLNVTPHYNWRCHSSEDIPEEFWTAGYVSNDC